VFEPVDTQPPAVKSLLRNQVDSKCANDYHRHDAVF
jgi:hypothetical protein